MNILSLFILCLSFAGAAFANEFAGGTQCRLFPDQGRGSFIGAWQRLPITLVLDREFYTANNGRDAQAILRAARTWNQWARLKGKTAFVVQNANQGVEIPNMLNTCSQADYTAAMRGAVGIWKITNRGQHANQRGCGRILSLGTQGQTDWVFRGGQILNASMMMNFDDYNRPGKPALDVESVALHELGHVLGMLHSCNAGSAGHPDSTSAPFCRLSPPHYRNAVMSPLFAPGMVRRQLQQNDYDRVNCLY